MKKSIILLIINIIINTIIITSRIRIFPWFIEDGWGYIFLLITTPIFMILTYLFSKEKGLGYKIYLTSSLISIFINFANIFLYSSDLLTNISLIIMALTFMFSILTTVFLKKL